MTSLGILPDWGSYFEFGNTSGFASPGGADYACPNQNGRKEGELGAGKTEKVDNLSTSLIYKTRGAGFTKK